jgi:hypothetical protein
VDGLELKPSGAFTLDQIDVFAGYFYSGWTSRLDQVLLKPISGYPKRTANSWDTSVAFLTTNSPEPITLMERLEPIDAASFHVIYEASHPTGVSTQEMFLQMEVPLSVGTGKTITLNGVAHPLPADLKESLIFADYKVEPRVLVLPGASGTVTIKGTFSVIVQDQRQWKHNAYSLRLRFSPASDPLVRAGLAVDFRYAPYHSTPLSIRSVANFGFSDDVAGDGKGGWTDQGSDNDMRSLPSGPLKAAGVLFDIMNATTNNGRGAIVLGKSSQPFLPKAVTIPMPTTAESKEWRNLYLLHASGWTPPSGKEVGLVILRHPDGTETSLDIVSGRDVGNWWAPTALESAAVGWTGDNASSGIGLYVSKVPLGDKPVKEIRLESVGTAMWLVAGVSASASDIVPFAPSAPFTVTANHEWVAYKHELDIVPGSVFDFSGLVYAPAGQYGALAATPDGHFAFADKPGVRARFWGVNLCFGANYLEKDVADRLAERFARSGYNTVRFHHYDGELQLKGGASADLDPAQLDRLDYLFSAMKKRGVYVNIDLYTIRDFSREELVEMGLATPGKSGPDLSTHWRFKAIMPVSEKAFDLWAEFARKMLTHRNPYTGLTWGEDPALIGICPVNENPPGGLIENDPVIKRAYQQAFETWWAVPANRTLAGTDRAQAFNRFAHEAQVKLDDRLRNFIRSLGVKTLLTGSNCNESEGLAFVRSRYDYVDNHQYWDHPSFPQAQFKFPFQFRQASSVRFSAQTPRNLMPTRIIGKPFAVTEFNFVNPNGYRAEGAALVPAYASLQDWDALYNFDYSSSVRNIIYPSAGGGAFSISADPIGQIADRVGAAVFLRGDVLPAKGEIGFSVRESTAFSILLKPFPAAFSKIGLVTRIGSLPIAPSVLIKDQAVKAVVVEQSDYPKVTGARIYASDDDLGAKLMRDGILPADSISTDGKRFKSETGQIELRSDEGAFKVVTPRSELFVLPAQVSMSGDCVAVHNGETFGSISVLAVDGKSIAESSRLLVTHLTDALPTGARFQADDRHLQESVGELPHLIRRGSAELTLKLATDGDYKAWAVSASGAHQREVPLTKTAYGWVLKVETVTKEGTQLAYEIKRN